MYFNSNSREVLQNDPCGVEWDFNRLSLILFPFQYIVDILCLHLKLITIAHSRFQQDTDGIRQAVCVVTLIRIIIVLQNVEM